MKGGKKKSTRIERDIPSHLGNDSGLYLLTGDL